MPAARQANAGNAENPFSWSPHLPALASSETLYSWCGEFHRRSCLTDTCATSTALFGDPHAARRHDLPANLNVLADRTGGLLGSAIELALKHTLLGFYLAFLPRARARALLHAVVDGKAPHLKLQLGIPASRLGARHPLRYCGSCVQESRRDLGWPIWHLHHQLPAVSVCELHASPLWQSKDQVTPVHRRQFFSPPDTGSTAYKHLVVEDDRQLASSLRLASWARHAAAAPPGSLGAEKLGDIYRTWAHRVGALTPAGSIRYSIMLDALNHRRESLNIATMTEAAALATVDPAHLVAAALRSPPRAMHPVKHLILLSAMFDSWGAFRSELDSLADDKAAQPRVECPSPVTQVRVEGKQAMERARRDFLLAVEGHMSVRAASRLVGVTTNTGLRWAYRSGIEVHQKSKVLRGSVLEHLRDSLAVGQDRKVAASEAGIALTTVNRLLSVDGELNEQWRTARFDRTLRGRRALLQELVRTHPGWSSTQIRRLAPAVWAWLYRNDRDWLRYNLPAMWQP